MKGWAAWERIGGTDDSLTPAIGPRGGTAGDPAVGRERRGARAFQRYQRRLGPAARKAEDRDRRDARRRKAPPMPNGHSVSSPDARQVAPGGGTAGTWLDPTCRLNIFNRTI